MKQRLMLLIPLMLSLMTCWAQTTPKSQLIYCSCAATPYGIPDKGKDYFELIADEGIIPKVVRCTDAGTHLEKKKERTVTAEDVKRMQQILQDLDVGKLKGYNRDDEMMGGTSYRVYMEYADGQKINATWYTHEPKELAVTTYNTILRTLSAFFEQGSGSKDEQMKHIREVYSIAKQLVATNGKGGKSPHDMTITLNDGTQVDEDFIINEETELKFFFKKKYEPTDEVIDPTSACYFIAEEFSAHGHLINREWLFDPEKGHLLFVFTRTETDAGHVFENRYYYDEDGDLIEQKKKEGGKDVDEVDMEPYDGGMELKQAKQYLEVFETMVNRKEVEQAESNVKTTAKADRLKMIKSTYTSAKNKEAKNSKSELPRDMRIVIHDQLAEDYPPVTNDVKFFFELDEKGGNHCYFISDQRNSMYFKEYGEYLLAPDSHKLIFSFTQATEEGETYEYRYYFDENGECIDRKVKSPEVEDEGDSGVDDKEEFNKYIKVFDMLANTSM